MSLVGILGYPIVTRFIKPRHVSSSLSQSEVGSEDGRCVGDTMAFEAYVRRARRISGAAFLAGIGLVVLAIFRDVLWIFPAVVLLLGAVFDWLRGRLGATFKVAGDELFIERGPLAGRKLRREDVKAAGFGAPARNGHRAPETFWRGDFGGEGESHLVVVRLRSATVNARRLIVPERDVAAARRAVEHLADWLLRS